MRVSGRDAETLGRQSHQCPTITAAPRCSPFSVVVTFVLVSVPLSSVLFMSWVCEHSKNKNKTKTQNHTESRVPHSSTRVFYVCPTHVHVTSCVDWVWLLAGISGFRYSVCSLRFCSGNWCLLSLLCSVLTTPCYYSKCPSHGCSIVGYS